MRARPKPCATCMRSHASEYPDSYGDRVEELFDVLHQFPIEDEHDDD